MAHLHDVQDNDSVFFIDPLSREIISQNPNKTLLIQGDHNSEEFTFLVPQYIDGHDLTLCNKVRVHYINIGANDNAAVPERSPGVYEIPRDKISQTRIEIDDVSGVGEPIDGLSLKWLISDNATKYVGTLAFLVQFLCTSEGTDETGKPISITDYKWHTSPYDSMVIAEGMDYSGETVDRYTDVLEQWYVEFINLIEDKTSTTVIEYIENHAKPEIKEYAEEMVDDRVEEKLGEYVKKKGDTFTGILKFTTDGAPTNCGGEVRATWSENEKACGMNFTATTDWNAHNSEKTMIKLFPHESVPDKDRIKLGLTHANASGTHELSWYALYGAHHLPAATSSAMGGVKSGGDISVNANGVVTVSHATSADTATSAGSAGSAGYADTANSATTADRASEADHATTADRATNATNAEKATLATRAADATRADYSTKAMNDYNGNAIHKTYATKDSLSSYAKTSELTDGSITVQKAMCDDLGDTIRAKYVIADQLSRGTFVPLKAACDNNGDLITTTYLKKSGLDMYMHTISILGYYTSTKGNDSMHLSFTIMTPTDAKNDNGIVFSQPVHVEDWLEAVLPDNTVIPASGVYKSSSSGTKYPIQGISYITSYSGAYRYLNLHTPDGLASWDVVFDSSIKLTYISVTSIKVPLHAQRSIKYPPD